MEATEGMMVKYDQHHTSNNITDNYEILSITNIGFNTKIIHVIRVRGSGDTDKKIHEIPYLNDIRFMWNGRPCIDFTDKVMYPLNNGLASITLGKASLYTTALERDPAGILGNPLPAAATTDQTAEHELRVERLYACLLNYIDRNSAIYKTFMRDFQRDGISVYKCILAIGIIPTPIRILEARSDAWKQMSMKALKIPYSIDGFLKWAEIVEEQGRICAKSGDEQKNKFIQGLPEFFANHAAQMEKDKVVYPATYGAMTGFTSAPHAATAHPLAGRPWVSQLARTYISQWCNEISEIHQHVPSGMVRAVELLSAEDSESGFLNLLAKDITPLTECYICGGKGHAASQLHDGVVIECANKQLTKLGILPVSSRDPIHSLKKKYTQLAEMVDTLKLQNAQLSIAISAPKRASAQSSRATISLAQDTTDDSQLDESEHDSDDDDDASVNSHESSIANMANSTLQSGLGKSKFSPRRKGSFRPK